jgi:hypothetical protein
MLLSLMSAAWNDAARLDMPVATDGVGCGSWSRQPELRHDAETLIATELLEAGIATAQPCSLLAKAKAGVAVHYFLFVP